MRLLVWRVLAGTALAVLVGALLLGAGDVIPPQLMLKLAAAGFAVGLVAFMVVP